MGFLVGFSMFLGTVHVHHTTCLSLLVVGRIPDDEFDLDLRILVHCSLLLAATATAVLGIILVIR